MNIQHPAQGFPQDNIKYLVNEQMATEHWETEMMVKEKNMNYISIFSLKKKVYYQMGSIKSSRMDKNIIFYIARYNEPCIPTRLDVLVNKAFQAIYELP